MYADPTGEGFWDTLKEIGKKVVEVAVVVTVAAVVVAGTVATGGGLLAAAGIGASVGGAAAAAATVAGTVAVAGASVAVAGATAVAAGSIGIYYSTNNNHGKQKGKEFRGGTKKQRDRWFGYENNTPFKKWFERVGKKYYNNGYDIDSKETADFLYRLWRSLGSPFPK